MTKQEQEYQDACLKELRSLVGDRITGLIKDDQGFFGFRTEKDIHVWILRDPEGNGPGFCELNNRV